MINKKIANIRCGFANIFNSVNSSVEEGKFWENLPTTLALTGASVIWLIADIFRFIFRIKEPEK